MGVSILSLSILSPNSTHPVVMGIPSGHGGGTATLPLGLRVRLAGQRLSFLESPFGDG